MVTLPHDIGQRIVLTKCEEAISSYKLCGLQAAHDR